MDATKVNRKILIIYAVILIFLIFGLAYNFFGDVRREDLNSNIYALKTDLDSKKADLDIKYDTLNACLSTKVEIDTTEEVFYSAFTDIGLFTIIFNNLEKKYNGSCLFLQIGNLTSAAIKSFSINVGYRKKRHNNAPAEIQYTGEKILNTKLLPGMWHNIYIDIAGLTPEELDNVFTIEFLSISIELKVLK